MCLDLEWTDACRVRRARNEGGFTLVEVMMVVLIIGILLSVAIPTYTGARDRGEDAAALARLRVVADTAYSLSDFGTNFTRATPGEIALAEPWLEYVNSTQPSLDRDSVSINSSLPTQWAAVVQAGAGECLGVVIVASGRQFYPSPSCQASSVDQEWTNSPNYVAPPPTPAIDGAAGFEGFVPDATDFAPGQEYQSNDQFFVFFESAQVLGADLTVAGVTIPSGSSVCSHIVWFDPSTDWAAVEATIDFGSPILVGAGTRAELRTTDQFAVPGVNYFDYNRPWDRADSFTFSGSEGYFSALALGNNADMIRILTDCG